MKYTNLSFEEIQTKIDETTSQIYVVWEKLSKEKDKVKCNFLNKELESLQVEHFELSTSHLYNFANI